MVLTVKIRSVCSVTLTLSYVGLNNASVAPTCNFSDLRLAAIGCFTIMPNIMTRYNENFTYTRIFVIVKQVKKLDKLDKKRVRYEVMDCNKTRSKGYNYEYLDIITSISHYYNHAVRIESVDAAQAIAGVTPVGPFSSSLVTTGCSLLRGLSTGGHSQPYFFPLEGSEANHLSMLCRPKSRPTFLISSKWPKSSTEYWLMGGMM